MKRLRALLASERQTWTSRLREAETHCQDALHAFQEDHEHGGKMAAYVLAQLAVASPKSVLHLIDQIEQELDFCEAEQLEWEVVMDRLDRLASNNPD